MNRPTAGNSEGCYPRKDIGPGGTSPLCSPTTVWEPENRKGVTLRLYALPGPEWDPISPGGSGPPAHLCRWDRRVCINEQHKTFAYICITRSYWLTDPSLPEKLIISQLLDARNGANLTDGPTMRFEGAPCRVNGTRPLTEVGCEAWFAGRGKFQPLTLTPTTLTLTTTTLNTTTISLKGT